MQKETLILASNNAGKLREMREILEPVGLKSVHRKKLVLPQKLLKQAQPFRKMPS